MMPPVSLEDAERAVADLLRALGEDPEDPRLRRTPHRVATTLFAALERPDLPAVAPLDRAESRDLITLSSIPFQSLCEHHLLPFRGVVDISYLPDGKVVGVSVPVRVVEHFARGLQIQERMTDDIADWLHSNLGARGISVIIEAEHLCMSFRGIGNQTTSLKTRAFRGELHNSNANIHQ